jgi:putative sterol carrier protein
MTDTDLSSDALGRLRPDELVDLIDGLDAAEPGLAGLDVDVIGQLIDPRTLRKDGFVRILTALERLAAAGAPLDLGKMAAGTFARMISRASTDQVQGVMVRPELRARMLDEIFRRMGDHLRADRAAHTAAVVHWRLTGGVGEGGFDRYETIIEEGTCTVHRESTRDPRVTVTMHPVDFLKLVTRNASAPVLFLTGKVKVKGDLGFAAGMTNLFDLPKG